MHKAIPWIGIAAAVTVAALIAVAGGSGGGDLGGLPGMPALVALAFAVQWVAFVPAWLGRTERFFDLTGSATFLLVVATALLGSGVRDVRSVLIALLIAVWALRLGPFLYRRVRQAGEDRRFRQIKVHLPTFLMTWTLQGLWVSLTSAPAVAAILASEPLAPDWTLVAGTALWLVGFTIEVVADAQKTRFRAQPENRDGYITSGLWAWSRHPNYFGEIMLWTGIAVMALPTLEGWQYATLVSPVFVWLLLTRISGVRMLEARANRKWRDDAGYQDYVRRTSTLLPLPPRRS